MEKGYFVDVPIDFYIILNQIVLDILTLAIPFKIDT